MLRNSENGRTSVGRDELEYTLAAMNDLWRSIVLVARDRIPKAVLGYGDGFEKSLPVNPDFFEDNLHKGMFLKDGLTEIVIRPLAKVESHGAEKIERFMSITEYHRVVENVSVATVKMRIVEVDSSGKLKLKAIAWETKKSSRSFQAVEADRLYTEIPLNVAGN